ncbi:unnamed protein product [Schistosoma curassoni]|uniref:CTNNB1_binding domain-containing protein n=1 Tax=Schistosoma curassoni TaxID=6186 RepID=A0A183JMR4_9TREM|nr:unnamed protein product [Schistosoma curassoni]
MHEQTDLEAPAKGLQSNSVCSDLSTGEHEDDNADCSKLFNNPASTASECEINKLGDDEEDNDSCDSFSPHTRAARSMHRYEPKQVHKHTESSTVGDLPNKSSVTVSSVSVTQNSM